MVLLAITTSCVVKKQKKKKKKKQKNKKKHTQNEIENILSLNTFHLLQYSH